jgi:prevent-host-death family protein
MRTATVRDLRNHYTSLLRWISAGEEILITQKGVVIARLVPASAQSAQIVNWADSPEVRRDRSRDTILSAKQTAALIAEAGGKW